MSDKLVSGEIERTTSVKSMRIGSIIVYEVTDTELKILRDNNNSSTLFNLSIAFFSGSISFWISYFTCDFTYAPIKEGIYITVAVSLLIFSFILFYLYRKDKSDINKLYETIKNRDY